MFHRVSVLAMAALLAFTVGCFKYNIKSGAGGNMSGPPKKDDWQMHFVFGLIGEGNVDVQSVCGGNDATVHIERTFLDGIIALCTDQLVGPSHIQVYCGGGGGGGGAPATSSVDVPVSKEQAQKIVKSDEFRAAVAEQAPERLAEVDALRAAY